MSKHNYNLSQIPGFTEFIEKGSISDEYEKYYNVKNYSTKANEKYQIIRYNKDFLSYDLFSTFGLLRSVVLSQSKIVSFAPPKSITAETFMTRYPTKNDNIIAEEFVEGTMVNVFYDNNYSANGGWQISTRNTVGANVSFYKGASKKTFNEMFNEACIRNNFMISTLNSNYCYSFVLQHPENRIVTPFHSPQLYLIAVYEIVQKNNEIYVTEQDMKDVKNLGMWNYTGIKFPFKYEFSKYSELIDKFGSANTPYDTVGIIIKNLETGERTKIRNPIYEEVKSLRGNQPKLQYQYLCLRHSGRVAEFLNYYPESKPDFSKYRDHVHMFTDTLFKNYIGCYVHKEKPLKEYSHQFRTHMYNIHQIFINNLKPQNLFVTNTVVIKYVNQLHPSLLMYCLNYNMRKRSIDCIKNDNENV